MTASDKFKIVRRHYLIALICSCVFLVALCQAYPTMTWQLEQLAQAPVLATCVVEETNRDSSVVMASYHSNTVAKLASDGTLLGTFAVDNNPWGVGFDGANIWVTNFGSNTVSKL